MPTRCCLPTTSSFHDALPPSFVCSVLLALAGCTVGPNHVEPVRELPASWSAVGRPDIAAAGDDQELADWWKVFNDPVLSDLIDRAVAANLELRVAEARIDETRALRRMASAGLWPEADVGVSYDRSSRGSSSGEGVDSGGTGREGDLYRASLNALWEIDLFGGTRRAAEAAEADQDAAVEEYRATLVRLLGDVVANYVEVRGLDAELASTTANLAAQRETLRLSILRRDVGLSSDFDVERIRALADSTAAEVPELHAQRAAAVHRLGVLVGDTPTSVVRVLAPHASVPHAPAAIALGVPVDLLRRRPDVRAAERQLAAATARVGTAVADKYPRLTLVGTVGLRSDDIAAFFTGESLVSSFGPSLVLPLFAGGRLNANVDAHQARREQALLEWELAVLRALEQVETAYARLEHEKSRRVALESAASADRNAAEMAVELWASGLAEFLEVLDTERSRLSSERLLARSEAAVATRVAALYVALGGGWQLADTELADPGASRQPAEPGASRQLEESN